MPNHRLQARTNVRTGRTDSSYSPIGRPHIKVKPIRAALLTTRHFDRSGRIPASRPIPGLSPRVRFRRISPSASPLGEGRHYRSDSGRSTNTEWTALRARSLREHVGSCHNRGADYSLNCAERQRTAAGTPSVVAIWRKRAPSSVVVA